MAEVKVLCKRQEMLLLDKRRILLKFSDLFEALDNMNKWCDSAETHLARDTHHGDEQEVLSQIRQIEFLISKSRDIKIRGRQDFEQDFDDIKVVDCSSIFAGRTLTGSCAGYNLQQDAVPGGRQYPAAGGGEGPSGGAAGEVEREGCRRRKH